ncbi:MAG: DUF3515 family protein [Flaviflexus sp.]|nr:DUF3515 family protein [Flaviflexus sp.]
MKRAAAIAAGFLLAACSPTVGLDPAEHASDPICARMLFATPDNIGGFDRSPTTSQATTAWSKAVTMRCGLEPPPPSTDRCISVGEGEDRVDWLNLDADDPRLPSNAQGGEGTWTFLSYGRTPAVEVVISVEAVGDGAVADLLTQFSPALNLVPAERQCVGPTDLAEREALLDDPSGATDSGEDEG